MQVYTQKNCFKNVLEFLEKSEKIYPQKTAFADEKRAVSYSQILKESRQIGSSLAEYMIPRKPIPVLAEKSVDVIAAFFGIVYAGCFYVLLDPKHPTARIRQILDTLDAEILITTEAYQKELDALEFAGKVFYIEDLKRGNVCEERLNSVRKQALDIDPLYTIFTSGSTGIPKGVVVSHRSVIDFMEYFPHLFGITHEDIIGNQAPFDFDVSVKDIYSTITTGATMEIIPKQCFSFPVKLLDYLCEKKITTLIWAVSALCIITTLKGFEYRVPETVNKVLFSGEVMPVRHLNQWMKYLPEASFINLYGPTEITCNCTYYRITRTYEPGENIPIGVPFPNEKVFLLDEKDALITEPNIKGELCVSGTALALGYYNNPAQTSKVFVQNPLQNQYLETIYRTGDLAYYTEDGLLMYASRKDFQIKHMGHRIELGEIETSMERVEAIRRVCCVFYEEKGRIIAFYEGDIEKKEIVAEISKGLPPFMIPNVFSKVERMPLTKNGKIDRKELLRQYIEKRGKK